MLVHMWSARAVFHPGRRKQCLNSRKLPCPWYRGDGRLQGKFLLLQIGAARQPAALQIFARCSYQEISGLLRGTLQV